MIFRQGTLLLPDSKATSGFFDLNNLPEYEAARSSWQSFEILINSSVRVYSWNNRDSYRRPVLPSKANPILLLAGCAVKPISFDVYGLAQWGASVNLSAGKALIRSGGSFASLPEPKLICSIKSPSCPISFTLKRISGFRLMKFRKP